MAIIAISSELIFYCGGGKEFNFMYIIAGLGNPGKEYAGTRHNAGFAVIDALADKYNIDVDTAKHKGLIGKGIIDGQKVILVKPLTYMNLSGECIREVMDYYKADIDDLIVIFDDISLEPGRLRLRAKGSASQILFWMKKECADSRDFFREEVFSMGTYPMYLKR